MSLWKYLLLLLVNMFIISCASSKKPKKPIYQNDTPSDSDDSQRDEEDRGEGEDEEEDKSPDSPDDDDQDDDTPDTEDDTIENLPILLWENAEWTKHIIEELKTQKVHEITVNDSAKYCKTYPSLNDSQKTYAWAYFMSAMAEKESSFNPDASFEETSVDRNNNNIISRGLFQISIESANQSAYQCNFKKEDELHNPLLNISCSVKILSYLVNKDKVLGSEGSTNIGGSQYWSVLRNNNKNEDIKKKTDQFCYNLLNLENSIVLKLNDGMNSGRPEMMSKVLELQQLLKDQGYTLAVDGYYGNETKSTIEKFQTNNQLDVNGNYVTEELWDIIVSKS